MADFEPNKNNILLIKDFKALGVERMFDIEVEDLLEYLRDQLQSAGEDLTDPTKKRESCDIIVGVGMKNAAMYLNLALKSFRG